MALLNHNYPSEGDMVVTEESGEPIEGAIVRVYDHTAYFADVLDSWEGETLTDVEGKWVDPIEVADGQSWVVWFEKPTMYGPRHIEITT